MLSRTQSRTSRGGSGCLARKREQEQEEAARRQAEEAAMSWPQVELQALRGTDAGMSLLMAVEFATSGPAQRVALQMLCC
jgi:hypothetical protein